MSTAITIHALHRVWHSADWGQLWQSIWNKKGRWRTLALVPAGPGASDETFLQIAMMLAHTGESYSGAPIRVTNAAQQQVTLASSGLARYAQETEQTLLALAPLSESGETLRLARAADCALLCIVAGGMSRTDAKKTIAQIGASHFVGSAVFHLAPETPTVQAPGADDTPPYKQ